MWVGSVKKGPVLDLAYAPDGRSLFSLDGGGQVTRWDLATRTATPLFTVEQYAYPEECPARLAVSPDGRFLLATDDERIAVWDLTAGQPRPPTDCDDGSITFPCFVNGGRELYTVGMAAHWLIRWSWPGLEELGVPKALAAVTEFPFGAAADPTGARLAVFSGPVVVWDVAAERLLMSIDVDDAGDFDDVPTAFAPGGETFVVGFEKVVRVCAVGAGKVTHTIDLDAALLRVAFHPAGRLFATAGAGPVVTFWDVESGRSISTWTTTCKKVQALAFSPDGCTCAAGGTGRKFAVWDVEAT
jgi:WD40 repeat protein